MNKKAISSMGKAVFMIFLLIGSFLFAFWNADNGLEKSGAAGELNTVTSTSSKNKPVEIRAITTSDLRGWTNKGLASIFGVNNYLTFRNSKYLVSLFGSPYVYQPSKEVMVDWPLERRMQYTGVVGMLMGEASAVEKPFEKNSGDNIATQAGKGLVNGVVDFGSSVVLSPFGLTTLGAGTGKEAISKVISGTFSVDLTLGTIEGVKSSYDAFSKGDIQGGVEALTVATGSGFFAYGTAKHTLAKEVPVVTSVDVKFEDGTTLYVPAEDAYGSAVAELRRSYSDAGLKFSEEKTSNQVVKSETPSSQSSNLNLNDRTALAIAKGIYQRDPAFESTKTSISETIKKIVEENDAAREIGEGPEKSSVLELGDYGFSRVVLVTQGKGEIDTVTYRGTIITSAVAEGGTAAGRHITTADGLDVTVIFERGIKPQAETYGRTITAEVRTLLDHEAGGHPIVRALGIDEALAKDPRFQQFYSVLRRESGATVFPDGTVIDDLSIPDYLKGYPEHSIRGIAREMATRWFTGEEKGNFPSFFNEIMEGYVKEIKSAANELAPGESLPKPVSSQEAGVSAPYLGGYETSTSPSVLSTPTGRLALGLAASGLAILGGTILASVAGGEEIPPDQTPTLVIGDKNFYLGEDGKWYEEADYNPETGNIYLAPADGMTSLELDIFAMEAASLQSKTPAKSTESPSPESNQDSVKESDADYEASDEEASDIQDTGIEITTQDGSKVNLNNGDTVELTSNGIFGDITTEFRMEDGQLEESTENGWEVVEPERLEDIMENGNQWLFWDYTIDQVIISREDGAMEIFDPDDFNVAYVSSDTESPSPAETTNSERERINAANVAAEKTARAQIEDLTGSKATSEKATIEPNDEGGYRMAYALNGETRYIPMQDYVLTIIESEAKGTEASSQKTQDTSKYNNLLLDGIRKEESEKGQERYIAKESVETGWAGAILGGLANAIPVIGPIISSSSYFINEALESGIDSAGPYQISKNIAHSAVMAHMSVDEKITKWKTTKPTEDQTTDYIRTEEGGRIVAKWVKEDNDKSLERMYKLAGQEIPSIGTSERILIDATSWNGGSGKTVSAGIQYAMQEIGVDVQTVDGYLYEKTGTGNEVKYKSDTAELFIRWLHKPEQQQKYAGYIDDEDIRKAFYKGPVAVLNSPVFNIIDEESRQKNGVPAQITIPAEETERSDIKGLNYGKRVLDSVSEKAKEGNTPLVSYTSQDSNKITVTLAKEIPNSGGEWKAVKEEVEVDPELARAYRDSQRYLQYIYPNIDKYEVLTSVVRSEKEQKAIQETKGELAAAPGTSSHEGKAIDINVNHIAGLTKLSTNEVVVSLDQIYGKHRIARTNKDESWHYELLPETPSELDDQLKKQFPSMSDEERDENVRLAFGNVNEYYKLTPKTWGGVAEGHEITVGDESFLVTQVSYPSSGRVKIITQGVDGSPGQTIYMPTLEEIDDTISIKPSGDLKTSNIIGRPAVAPQVTVSPPAASPSTIAASTPNLGEQKTLPNQLFVTSKKTETKEGARVTEEQYIAEPTDTSWFSRTFGETEYISPDGTLNRKGGLFGSDRIGYVSEETSTGNYLVLSSNFNGFYDNYPRFSLLPTYGSGELRLFPDLKGEYDINTKHPTEETTVREVRDKTGKVVGTLEQKKEGEPPVFKPNTGIDPSTIVKGSSVKSTAPNTGQKFTWGLKGYLWNDEREVRYTTEGYFEVLDDNKNWVRPENLPSTSVRSDQEKAFIDKLAVVNQEEDRTRRDQVADWALKTTINYDGIFGIPIDVQNDVYLSKTDSKDGSTELWGDTAFQGNRRITSEDINSILGIGTSAVPPASAPATKSAASSPTDLSTKHPTELYDLASQGNTDAKKELETRSNLGDQEAAYYLDSLSTTSSTPIVNPPATANPTPATKSAATSPTLETPSPIPKMYEYTYVYDSDIGGKSEAIYALGEDFEWYVSSGEGASVEKVTDKNTVNALDDYFFSWLDYTPESDAQPSPAPNQQPTAPIVSGTLNPENPEEATHQQIIDAKAKNKKTLTYFMTDDQKYKLAYNLVWEFMDLALENWVYPMVDDMCKEDWDSSEATNSGSDTSSGGGGTGGTGAEATCTNHSYTGNLELNGTTHKIYYSISACSSSLTHYKVYLKSDGVSDYTIDEGYTVQGIVVRESLTKELPYQYTLLCIEVGESERCF